MHWIGSRDRVVSCEQRRTSRRSKSPVLIESLESRQLMSATPLEASGCLAPAPPFELADVSAFSASSPVILAENPVASSLAPQGLLATGMPLGNYVMLPTRG